MIYRNPAKAIKMTTQRLFLISMIWALIWFPSKSAAKAAKDKPAGLIVGTIAAPPFAMETAGDVWEGLSIDLWQAVASELGVQYEIQKYGTIGQLIEAIENEKLEVILALAGTEHREIALDLSHSYFRSGTAIAVSKDHAGRGWFGLFRRLEVSKIIIAVGLLILLWFFAGVIVLLFERRRNRDMFGGGPIKGLGHAVWWAAVTMTTVGYGDKAPKTVGGRAVAIAWMISSIFLISSFTAWISASLTAEKLTGKVRGHHDLPHVRVGSMAQSGTMKWLAERGVAPVPFSTEQEGLQAVVDDKIDAFAYDELVLKYIVKTDFPGRIQVLAGTFDHYYVCMALQKGSPLREPVNRALLKIMDQDEWEKRVARYIGPTG